MIGIDIQNITHLVFSIHTSAALRCANKQTNKHIIRTASLPCRLSTFAHLPELTRIKGEEDTKKVILACFIFGLCFPLPILFLSPHTAPPFSCTFFKKKWLF